MRLRPLAFEDLPGWSPDEIFAAWPAWVASCRAIASGLQPLRQGAPQRPEMAALCREALEMSADRAACRGFFHQNFKAFEVLDASGGCSGFVTGYYEPEVDASLERSREFSAPVLARPSDLVDVRGQRIDGWDPRFEGARRTSSGSLEPYPPRAAIEAGGIDQVSRPILWLRDPVEVFFTQVQGSARVRLPGGMRKRLVYDGRNGRPYTSIGRILIGRGEIPAEKMSLTHCKNWLRANGLKFGEPGRDVLHANESYVFFRLEDEEDASRGPVGAQGVALTSFRSLAVDRAIWPYGAPVWISADLNTAGIGDEFRGRLMIAQDTGSAIVGPARGDLFIGSGDRAGEIAGLIRHQARFFVFAPAEGYGHG